MTCGVEISRLPKIQQIAVVKRIGSGRLKGITEIRAAVNTLIEKESQTLATITFQNYFRMYHKLAGMTGTAKISGRHRSIAQQLSRSVWRWIRGLVW